MYQNLFWNLLAKKLAREASPAELKELEKLMKMHPELLYPAQHIEDLWKLTTDEDCFESEDAFKIHLAQLKKKGIKLAGLDSPDKEGAGIRDKESKRFLRQSWIAVPFLLICILSFFFWVLAKNKSGTVSPDKRMNEVFTLPGSKTRLVLADGSIVWLNSGSKFTYGDHFGVLNRSVNLSGEAFFDVKKSQVPFIIHTSALQVKVLGTAFNVKSYANENTTETSLLRGSVEITVDKQTDKFVLRPNEKLIVENEARNGMGLAHQKSTLYTVSPLTLAGDSTIIETSWVDNKLIFQNESFARIAEKMERWYGVIIHFKDPRVEALKITGCFEKKTVREALEELQITFNFHFSIKDNIITITL